MKFFLDTEFIENGPHKPIDLVSIGMVSEDGREYYAINSEFDPASACKWVVENVLNNLTPEADLQRKTLKQIGFDIVSFVWPDGALNRTKPEFWGYYADYDWVVFCQIFGSMVNLPERFPMYCRDLKQWCVQKGDPTLPKQESKEHNALNDAKWNRLAYEFLSNL